MKSTILICTVVTIVLFMFVKIGHPRTSSPSYMKSSIWENSSRNKSDTDLDKYKTTWDHEDELINDPLYGVNKIIFNFNDKLFFYLLKPTLTLYQSVLPVYFRVSIKNFFYNITMPQRFINCLLQGKWNEAQGEMARFIINSTFGVCGLFNPVSKHPELNPPSEDLGQTLGLYNVGNGPYIVWPIIGPSTLRDSIGLIGDFFLNPLNYIMENPNGKVLFPCLDKINNFSFGINRYETMKKISFDQYEAFRNAYIQNRNRKILQ